MRVSKFAIIFLLIFSVVFANTWTLKSPVTKPLGLADIGMAYDSANDRTIVFGGTYGVDHYWNETWVYNYSDDSWTDATIGSFPPARGGHSMIYDASADRIIMFGGYNGSNNYIAETWVFNFSDNSWTLMNPATSPSKRGWASMAYDSTSQTTILFGGTNNTAYNRETWAYNFSDNTWTLFSSSTPPTFRYGANMAYDSVNDHMIIFGGENASIYNAETLIYNQSDDSWTLMNPPTSPNYRHGHGLAYDSYNQRIILFGGYNGSIETTYNSELWMYNFGVNTWTLMTPSPVPSGRTNSQIVYDSSSKKTIMFAGKNGTWMNETWEYAFDTTPVAVVSSVNGTKTNESQDMLLTVQATDNEGDVRKYWVTVYHNNTAGNTYHANSTYYFINSSSAVNQTFFYKKANYSNHTNVTFQTIVGNLNATAINTSRYITVFGPCMQISNVQVKLVTNDTATVYWETNESASGLVNFNMTAPPFGFTNSSATLTTQHAFTLVGLYSNSYYEFEVSSTAGTCTATENRAGLYYNFTTEISSWCEDIGNYQDTDDDGGNDCDEVHIVDNWPYVTDPTDYDTDDDLFIDGEEVLLATDPTNTLSFPDKVEGTIYVALVFGLLETVLLLAIAVGIVFFINRD